MHMSLYMYSMWVYRVEKNLTARPTSATQPPVVQHVEMEFEETYPSRHTFVQRLAVEPRVPMVEGMQFVSDKDPETHAMLQSLLFRVSLQCTNSMLCLPMHNCSLGCGQRVGFPERCSLEGSTFLQVWPNAHVQTE